MSRLGQKEMGQKHRRDSTKHMWQVFFFFCQKGRLIKKVALNVIFAGTLSPHQSETQQRNQQRKRKSFFTSSPLEVISEHSFNSFAACR